MGKIATKISLALGLIVAMIFGSAPVSAFAAVIRSTYIVQVQDGHADEVRAAISHLGETPHDELTEVMDGFVLDLTDAEAEALRLEPSVIQVVADAPMSLLDVQSPTPSWGLDRIDQNATAGDSAYNFPASAGAGVRIYVVDTGVMASNPDFAGRILPGKDMMGQNLEAADCHGHGTHVAGTAAGTKYGVAKKAWIVPVRVLSCSGSGSWSYFISAMDWIIANNPAGTPAVMSASIGGGNYSLANTAVEKLYAAGITPVIAAGNSNVDACGTSPAGAPKAITVGASDINDARASFSNYGECVDVFAPGVNIISDKNTDPTGSTSMSGTSMATPHVSGLAALYLSGHQSATPAEVTSAIKTGGLAGAVANAQSTLGNILINNSFTRASVPVTPAPVYPPTGVTASAITSTSATISWTAPAVSTAATAPDSYKLEYKLVTDTSWTAVNTTSTSVALTGLTMLNNYVVRVTSIAGTQLSDPTAELQFSTLGSAPDAPTNLVSTAVYGNQIDLAWTKPLNSNGAPIGGYYIEQLINGNWTLYNNVGATYASVRNLTPLTSYSFRIKAYNTFGYSLPSNVLVVSTSAVTPAVPTTLSATNVTGTTATINWKAVPAIDPAVAITYRVNLLSRQTSNFGAVLGTFTTEVNSINLTGLKRTTYYGVTVTALSGTIAGPTSTQFVFSTTATKASAPSTRAVKTATGFDILWSVPADDGGSAITGYQVEKQNADGTWAIVASLAATAPTSCSVPAPARASSDNYRVGAVNAYGAGAYGTVTVTTAPGVPAAPTGLTLTRGTTASVLNWVTPVDNGGSPVTYYAVYRSADNGTTWTALNTVVLTNTFSVVIPAKGVKYLYYVAARNVTGTGPGSNTVSDETAATVPGTVRSIAFSNPTADKLQISWGTPIDGGGAVITAYRLERQAADGTWSVLTESNVTSFQIDRDLPGVLVNIRVTAINSIGAGAALAASWRTPFVQSSAPQNFTAVDNGSAVVVAWTAPADLGGSAVSAYIVQFSRDGGTTWSNLISVSANVLTYNVPRPTKGTTWSYRVTASTAFGYSLPSAAVAISAALTAPGAPGIRSLIFAQDGSMSLTWVLGADNGGSAITGVVVEKSNDNLTWSALPALAANATSLSLPRELPGVRVYFRVRAVNTIGTSAASGVLTLFTPYVKASAPQNFAAVDNVSSVTVSWTAPANLGGSTVSQYSIFVSRDGGTTWNAAAYKAASVFTATVARPAKGATWQYRMSARTGFGDSEFTNAISISAGTTVASAPSLRNLVVNVDGTLTATWLAPSDLGGTALTGYIVERSADNVNWTALPTLAANVLTLTIPGNGPGARTYLRVKATNAVGVSVASGVASIMVPYVKATSPIGLTAALVSGRVQLTWSAPANNGGSTISYYQVEASTNGGASWILMANVNALTVGLTPPAKGVTASYRVTARTAFGLGDYSNVATATNPNTVASNVRITGVTKVAAGSFGLTFVAPTDLGGYSSYTYRVEVYVNGAWSVVGSGAGAASNYLVITTPNTTASYTYRVIANNPSGDSYPMSFSYKG